MKVSYSRQAAKALLKCNKRVLLREKIDAFASSPALLLANVTKLQGREEFRLRVQDWRVIFKVSDGEMVILDIAPRGSVYEVKK